MPSPGPVVLTGANGFLGRLLTAFLANEGRSVIRIARSGGDYDWDGRTLGPWTVALEGASALINLAGRSVNCRYGPAERRQILESRVESTRVLGQALAGCRRPPAVWLNASSATVYRHAEDRPMDEASGETGADFSPQVVLAWEKAFFEAHVPSGIRRVAMRTAIVFDRANGGAFDYYRRLVLFGLGGAHGNGRQMMSWIHGHDFCRAVAWLLADDELSGIVNVAAPGPLTNRDLMAALRRAYGRRIGLPASRWMLEAGAILLRTETELILKSRWVLPRRLLDSGFEFSYPDWPTAATALAGATSPASSPSPRPAEPPLPAPPPASP